MDLHGLLRAVMVGLSCAAPLASVNAEAPAEAEPAPVYAEQGFAKPAEREPGCIGRSVQLPPDLAGLEATVYAKFAVGADGTPSHFSLLATGGDARVGEAVWKGIRSCEFIPGRDKAGRSVAIWMILPIKFHRG